MIGSWAIEYRLRDSDICSMTDYAGEEYLVTHVALDIDKTPLTSIDVKFVKITIFASDGSMVVPEDEMDWNATAAWSIKVGSATYVGSGWWQYVWDTSGYDPGTYKARVVLTGLNDGESIEILRLRLARDPLAA